ncbi:hypothetical protein OZX60_06780 [Streptococcaceae bacterium ESL0687]|nr:hypothetical protein OZX60_06780 [Streptococcaceae bacterium ESL0687]
MNAKKLLGLGLAGAVLLGAGSTAAFADDVDHEVQTQTDDTTVTVNVIDESDPDPIAPVTPTDPTSPVLPGQTRLTLNHVPTAYIFNTEVSDTTYTATASTIGSGTSGDGSEDIVVFNSKVGRRWKVKASVTDPENGNVVTGNTGQLTINKSGAKYFPVTAFNITSSGDNGTGTTPVNAATTGYQAIVAQDVYGKSGTTLSATNNTSTMTIPVSAVSITFTDADHVLQVNDVVSGTISYQLYMVTE